MVKSYNFFTGTSLLAMFNILNVATLAIFYTGLTEYSPGDVINDE